MSDPPSNPNSRRFPSQEVATAHNELLVEVLARFVEIGVEVDQAITALSDEGYSSHSRTIAIDKIIAIKNKLRELEEFLGLY
jgi:hypothetical protein